MSRHTQSQAQAKFRDPDVCPRWALKRGKAIASCPSPVALAGDLTKGDTRWLDRRSSLAEVRVIGVKLMTRSTHGRARQRFTIGTLAFTAVAVVRRVRMMGGG